MKIFSAVFLLLASLMLTAADAPDNSGSQRGERSKRSGMRGNRMLEQLKAKYPKEVEEITRLQESSPEQARTKFFELMRKAGPEMGFRGGFGGRREGRGMRDIELSEAQIAELKNKFPKEFAEYEKLKESDPDKAREKLHALAKKAFGEQQIAQDSIYRDRSRRAVAFVRMELKRLYPERYEEIVKLEKSDPDAARRELRKLFAESNIRIPHGARELNYQYVDPKLNNQFNRPGMMNMRQNYPGGRMLGPGGNNWRR